MLMRIEGWKILNLCFTVRKKEREEERKRERERGREGGIDNVGNTGGGRWVTTVKYTVYGVGITSIGNYH